jgi:hypothetical protein
MMNTDLFEKDYNNSAASVGSCADGLQLQVTMLHYLSRYLGQGATLLIDTSRAYLPVSQTTTATPDVIERCILTQGLQDRGILIGNLIKVEVPRRVSSYSRIDPCPPWSHRRRSTPFTCPTRPHPLPPVLPRGSHIACRKVSRKARERQEQGCPRVHHRVQGGRTGLTPLSSAESKS